MLWTLVALSILAPFVIVALLTIGGKVLIVTPIILGLLTVLVIASPFIKGSSKP